MLKKRLASLKIRDQEGLDKSRPGCGDAPSGCFQRIPFGAFQVPVTLAAEGRSTVPNGLLVDIGKKASRIHKVDWCFVPDNPLPDWMPLDGKHAGYSQALSVFDA